MSCAWQVDFHPLCHQGVLDMLLKLSEPLKFFSAPPRPRPRRSLRSSRCSLRRSRRGAHCQRFWAEDGCASHVCWSWQICQGCLHQGLWIWLNKTWSENKIWEWTGIYELRFSQHRDHQSDGQPGNQVQMDWIWSDVYREMEHWQHAGHGDYCGRSGNAHLWKNAVLSSDICWPVLWLNLLVNFFSVQLARGLKLTFDSSFSPNTG